MLPVIPVDAHVILQSKGPADAGQSVLMNIAGFQFYSARRRRHKLTNGLAVQYGRALVDYQEVDASECGF